ncbi:LysM domain-containing protein [Paenibacillus illinoisensis]|uniref:LysM peptidoglycan-binding domain-containing protein n=1 Tax=Paenibacillus illinoisensis TaxID=59845 RepID=UPI001C8E66CE|nr:LysM domain-containing protein [Paenibacillus illinoisensis]MBY0217780.1 LysM peptidoglycan-binding domain-containing protein [Paenibacillus illinoisensis]
MSRIQELKERINSTRTGEMLLDLRKALQEEPIFNSAFQSLSSFTDFVLQNNLSVIETTPDTAIEITGELKVLDSFEAMMHLTIAMDETNQQLTGNLKATPTTSASIHDPLRLKGIPWLAFKDFELKFDIPGGEEYPFKGQVSFFVLAGNKWLQFATTYPLQDGNADLFIATLEGSNLSLEDLQPYFGGIKLTSPFDSDSSAVRQLSLDYDGQARLLRQLRAEIAVENLQLGNLIQIPSGQLKITAHSEEEGLRYDLVYEAQIGFPSGVLSISGSYEENRWKFVAEVHPAGSSPVILLTELFQALSIGGIPPWLANTSISISDFRWIIYSLPDNQIDYEGTATLKSSPGHLQSDLPLSFTSLVIKGSREHYQVALKASAGKNGQEAEVSIVYADGQWGSLCGELDSRELSQISGIDIPAATSAKLCYADPVWQLIAIAELSLPILENVTVRTRFTLAWENNQWEGAICGKVDFYGISLEACYNKETDAEAGRIITLSWNGIKLTPDGEIWTGVLNDSHTLGWLVEEAVSWVEGIRFGLSAPWDLLEGITLPNCEVKFNLPSKEFSVGFDLNWNLPFASVSDFEIKYTPEPPQGMDKLLFSLNGDFRLLHLDNPRKASWNPADPSAAPAPPGIGTGMFDLKFLALGQRVSIHSESVFPNVEKALGTLTQLEDNNPLKEKGITYDPSAGWIIASDMTFLKDISVGLIFNDPKLYALRVASGKSNPLFSGLVFEIMYQRVTDKIGLYQADITLPDSLRYLEFGAYSVTLPSFAIGIYTNGDFKIDIGFPHNFDFSRSCTVQTIVPPGIPLIGSAGFYINKLSGPTATSVPVSPYGQFSPVLEFGFGMRLGIGKEVHKGPLVAGFSVTAIGMLEGVLASWQPYGEKSSSRESTGLQLADQYYYKLKGTVGIQGRLYGNVDLSIIKASVDVAITLATQMVYEAYRDLEIAVVAEVDIKVKIKIGRGPFRIKINISYSASIRESFVIEASGSAPWDRSQADVLPEENGQRLNPCERDIEPIGSINWQNMVYVQGEELPLQIYAVLAPTAKLTEHGMQQVSVMLFSIGTMKDELPAEGEQRDAPSDFEKLSIKLFNWLLAAAGDSGPVNEDELLKSYISLERMYAVQKYFCADRVWSVIPKEAIEHFLEKHCKINIGTIPKACETPAGETALPEACVETTFFPAIPALSLSIIPDGQIAGEQWKFEEVSTADTAYLTELAEHFRTLAVEVEREQKAAGHFDGDLSNERMSIADFVLHDYFVTMIRQMLQGAAEVMEDYETNRKKEDQTDKTVLELCKEMYTLKNPDATAPKEDSVEIKHYRQELFERNADRPLHSGPLFITGAKHRITMGETWQSIAEMYWSLQSTENPSKFTIDDMLNWPDNLANEQLLTPGTYNSAGATSGTLIIEEKSTLLSLTGYKTEEGKIRVNPLLADYPEFKPRVSAEITIPRFEYLVQPGTETLEQIAAKFGVTVRSLAEDQENGNGRVLFDHPTVRFGKINQLGVGDLGSSMQSKGVIRNLSGMTSRFFLHGLRLRNEKGLDVHSRLLETQNQIDYGLFELTGQQFTIPESASLVLDSTVPWVQFINETE